MIAAHERRACDPVVDFETAAARLADPENVGPTAAIVYGGADVTTGSGAKSEGKGKGSRWNAVRHGCMAQTLLPADLQKEVDDFTAVFTERYQPTDIAERAAVATMGRTAAQLARNQKMKVVDLQRTMDRAIIEWDNDRAVYIDQLLERFDNGPGVVGALARSKHGAEWLLRTWRGLDEVLDIAGRWTDDQVGLAMKLSDTRPELWDTYRTELLEAPAKDLAAIVSREVDWLEESLEYALNSLDWADRLMAASGAPPEEDAVTKRLRKQESRLKLEFRRAKAEIEESRAAAAGGVPAAAPAQKPAPVVSSARAASKKDGDPPPRPATAKAVEKYMIGRLKLHDFEIPATATAPRATASGTRFPSPVVTPRPSRRPSRSPIWSCRAQRCPRSTPSRGRIWSPSRSACVLSRLASRAMPQRWPSTGVARRSDRPAGLRRRRRARLLAATADERAGRRQWRPREVLRGTIP